jgi:hypothetical protein
VVRTAALSDIPTQRQDYVPTADWKPVRRHFGIRSFGVNAYVAHADGVTVIAAHDEVSEDGTSHEELYFVASGHATFTVAGETLEAPAGTFVFVDDPAATRGALARTAGTTVLAFGAEPGAAFQVSEWELKYGP